MFFNLKLLNFKYFFICSLLILMPFFVNAEGYDFYVDGSAKSGGDGSEDEPFEEIEDAIEEAEEEGGGQEIYIKKGTYSGDFTIEKSIKLIGEDKDEVVISGTISMKNDSELKNLTIKGGTPAVLVLEDAEVEIEDCVIRDFGKIGIQVVPGDGKLTLEDSEIKDGDGKGIYLERGNRIKAIENEIVDNDEEGIDIRSNATGTISGNYIHDNNESGIELLVSDADLMISGNTIKDNNASAISIQFYEKYKEYGDISMEKNKMSDNENYGLDCKNTLGGTPPGLYWSKSVKMSGNTISGNEKGSINKFCSIEEEKVDDEKSSKEVSSVIEDDKQSENEKAKQLADQKLEEERELKEQERILKEQALIKEDRERRENLAKIILEKHNKQIETTEVNLEKVKKESRLKIFFFGVDSSIIDLVSVDLESQKQELIKAQDFLEDDYIEMSEGSELKKRIEEKLEEIKNQKEYLDKRKNSFSLIGWISGLF